MQKKPVRDDMTKAELNPLHFFECMDRIHRAMQSSNDLDEMMSHVLDEVLSIFDCDRAYMVFPCDPEARSWTVPMERTRPEYSSVSDLKTEFDMDQDVAEKMRLLLDSDGAMHFSSNTIPPLPKKIARQFESQSLIATVLRLKNSEPWEFGIHQCSHARSWSVAEKRLLLEIGRRVTDGMNTLMSMRQLQESEAKYRRFIETSNEGICALDETGLITFANQRMSEMLGYSSDEVIGKPVEGFMFEEDLADHTKRMKTRRQGKSENYERRLRRKDGSELWATASANAIYDKEGKFHGSFAMFSDITERKRIEQGIIARELDFRTLVENSPDPILRYDRNCRRVYVNPEIHRISGKPLDSLIGHKPEEAQLLSESESKKLTAAIRRTFDHDQASHVEFEFIDLNGDLHGYDMLLIPEHDTHGNVKTVLGIARDITERRQMEQALHANEERYRHAQAMGHVGNWEYNLQTTHFWGSDEAKLIYGFDPAADNFSTDEVESCIPDRDRVHQALINLIEKGEKYDLEFEIHPKDGSEPKIIVSTAELQRDEHGAPLKVVGLVQDVTERKQFESRLALMSFALNNVHEAAFLIDEQARFHFVNEEACRILGYSRDELMTMRVKDVDPDWPGSHWPEHWHELKRKKSMTFEGRHQTKDGHIFPVEINANFIDYEDQHYNLALVRDITERKQTEKELQASEQLFRALVENSPDFIARYDLNYRRVYINPAIQKLFQEPKENALGKIPSEESPVQVPQVYIDHLREVVATGTENILEAQFRTAEGEMHWGSIRFVPEYDANGKVSSILTIGHDIHKLKQAEAELKRSGLALREAQHIAKLGNWEVWHQQDHSLNWSDEMFNIHEISKADFDAANESFLARVHPDDRQMVSQAHIDSLDAHEDSFEVSYRLLMADGRVKFVHQMGRNYFDAEGTPLRSVGTMQDLTHLHEVEEQLQQAQKMEALGTLVGGIAHDFNNKLAAITGNLYLAQHSIDENSGTAERLRGVNKLCFDAAEMVKQLLTFARKGQVEMAPLALVSFIKETTKLNRVAIPENIKLSVTYDKDPLKIMGDITQLQQLFLNLLNNARDALEDVEQPKIDISLQYYEANHSFHEHHPELGHTKAFACMQVTDNGHGISPEHLEKVFEPFFTTKEVGKGTGLGLAMVYGIVQSHHGAIEVDSSPDKGTCFSIYLPIYSGEKTSTLPNIQQGLAIGQGEMILLADDDANVLSTFTEALHAMNYQVLTARNGREAVEMFRQHADSIDLVILDIIMPEMKGPQAAERIRKAKPNAKILFVTGYDSHEKGISLMGDEVTLEKPFALEKASTTIRNILDH